MRKRYASYKDSGVEWIGKIPSHWEGTQLRRLGDLYGGLKGKSGIDFRSENNANNKPYIPYTNIFNNTYISKDHFHQVVINEGENQNRVQKYDLFFLMSSETYEDLGKPSILIEDVEELYLNSFCKGFRVNRSQIFPLFLNYQLVGDIHKKLISIEGQGFTRINLRQDRLKDIPILLPSLPEQQQIVSYLDEKTSKIDSLIHSKQKKIALLKEKRTALISEVVTKGLDPNVEMKDSGVEWIGKIPVHWETAKLGHISTIVRGASPRPAGDPEFFDGEHVPWITVKEVTSTNGKYIIKTESYLTEKGMLKSRFLKSGTLVISNSGATLGVPAILKIDGCINDGSVAFLNLASKIYQEYLYYFLSTLTNTLREQQRGYGQPNLNTDIISRIAFPLPPSNEEQAAIVNYLDDQISEIGYLLQLEQNKITLLKEYRQSLISEVVTGKIRVVDYDLSHQEIETQNQAV